MIKQRRESDLRLSVLDTTQSMNKIDSPINVTIAHTKPRDFDAVGTLCFPPTEPC